MSKERAYVRMIDEVLINYWGYQQLQQIIQKMGNAAEICATSPCIKEPEASFNHDNELVVTQGQKLEPIVFNQHDNDPENHSAVEKQQITLQVEETPVKRRLVWDDTTVDCKKGSEQKVSRINLDSMVVINQSSNGLHHIIDDLIEVPYSVVRLTISDRLKHTLKEFGQDFMQKYDKEQNSSNHWKLHKKGFYLIRLGEQLYGVLNNSFYFQGELAEYGSQILPTNDGILISEQGIYVGSFYMGKANGKGTYKDADLKAIYKGEWENGVLVQGSIQNNAIRYEGTFQDALATGRGKLIFKEKEYTYQGYFEEGKMQDQKGFLESNYYIYEGGFQQGKKEGVGCLVEKQLTQKNKKLKYRPAEQYQGKWHQDSFEGQNPFTSLRK